MYNILFLEEETNNSDDGEDGGEGDGTSRAGESEGRGDGSGAEGSALVDGARAFVASASAASVGTISFRLENARSGVALCDLGISVLVGFGAVVAEASSDGREVVSDGVAGTRRLAFRVTTVDAEGVSVNGESGDDGDEDGNEGDKSGSAHVERT